MLRRASAESAALGAALKAANASTSVGLIGATFRSAAKGAGAEASFCASADTLADGADGCGEIGMTPIGRTMLDWFALLGCLMLLEA